MMHLCFIFVVGWTIRWSIETRKDLHSPYSNLISIIGIKRITLLCLSVVSKLRWRKKFAFQKPFIQFCVYSCYICGFFWHCTWRIQVRHSGFQNTNTNTKSKYRRYQGKQSKCLSRIRAGYHSSRERRMEAAFKIQPKAETYRIRRRIILVAPCEQWPRI